MYKIKNIILISTIIIFSKKSTIYNNHLIQNINIDQILLLVMDGISIAREKKTLCKFGRRLRTSDSMFKMFRVS